MNSLARIAILIMTTIMNNIVSRVQKNMSHSHCYVSVSLLSSHWLYCIGWCSSWPGISQGTNFKLEYGEKWSKWMELFNLDALWSHYIAVGIVAQDHNRINLGKKILKLHFNDTQCIRSWFPIIDQKFWI